MPPKPRNPAGKKTKKSVSTRAGLQLPVARIHKILKNGKYAPHIGKGASICMTAVLQYLCTEMLDLAAQTAEYNNKNRISPRHFLLAIRNDEELNKLLDGVIISQGGVIPHIVPEHLPKKTMKSQQTTNTKSSKKD